MLPPPPTPCLPPIMAYTGRLRPKGVPLLGFSYEKGRDFPSWGIWKGREICHFVISVCTKPKRANVCIL